MKLKSGLCIYNGSEIIVACIKPWQCYEKIPAVNVDQKCGSLKNNKSKLFWPTLLCFNLVNSELNYRFRMKCCNQVYSLIQGSGCRSMNVKRCTRVVIGKTNVFCENEIFWLTYCSLFCAISHPFIDFCLFVIVYVLYPHLSWKLLVKLKNFYTSVLSAMKEWHR